MLSDAVSCEVEESRNGEFELILQYPVNGKYFEYLENQNIIKAKPNNTDTIQLFQIYQVTKDTNGNAIVNAEHISYRLNYNTVAKQVLNGTPKTILSNLLRACIIEHGFTANSDIESNNKIEITQPSNPRSWLYGREGSLLDVFGGEYKFNNFEISLLKNRGKETNVKIEYGKNLISAKQESQIDQTYTAVYPFCTYTENEVEHIITLEEKLIYINSSLNSPYPRVLTLDLTSEFLDNEEKNAGKLRDKCLSYISKHNLGTPNINLSVEFAQLSQTSDYKNFQALENVDLCDTITVEFIKLGINAKAKVIKTNYDVLNERYNSIELGNAKSNFAATTINNFNNLNSNAAKINKLNSNVSSLSNEISQIQIAVDNLFLQAHPVGSIFISINSTNPGSLYGGTWVQFGSGRVLLGVGNNGTTNYNTSEITGGAETAASSNADGNTGSTALTVDQLPKIRGTLPHMAYGESKVSGVFSFETSGAAYAQEAQASSTSNEYNYKLRIGSGASHKHSLGSHNHSTNVIQPYITAYFFKRTR